MTTTTTTTPPEVALATDAELAAWTKALDAGTMSAPIEFGRAIFAERDRRKNLPTGRDVDPMHTISSVGYQIEVCIDVRDWSSWWVRPAGMVAPASIIAGPFTQAEAMVYACNMALGDLAEETGEPSASVAVVA